MNLILKGQIRAGKNNVQVTRTGHRYPTKTFKDWSTKAMLQIWEQIGYAHEIRPYDEPLAMTLDYWPGDARVRDIPAIVDALLHVLEAAGVVTNDKWVRRMKYAQHEIDKDNPRVVLELVAIAGEP